MSRSPKYSTVELTTELDAALAERARQERERLAAEARKREAERRKTLAASLRKDADRLCEQLGAELSRQERASYATYLDRTRLAEVAQAITEARQSAGLGTPEAAQVIVDRLKRAVRKLEKTGLRAAADLREAERREEERRKAEKRERDRNEYLRRREELRQLETRSTGATRMKFDAPGFGQVAEIRQQADILFGRGEFEKALIAVAAAVDAENRHHDAAVAAAELYEARLSVCRESFSTLAGEINGLSTDASVSRMVPSELVQLVAKHGEIRVRVQKEDVDGAIACCEQLAAEVEGVKALALARAAQSARRVVVVDALKASLKEMNFDVEDGGLERPLEFASDYRLRVRVTKSAEIAIKVPATGRVEYRPRGFSGMGERTRTDQPAECPEVLDILDDLKERALSRGLELGEITWEGKSSQENKRERVKRRKCATPQRALVRVR